jgi:hypothetical protein
LYHISNPRSILDPAEGSEMKPDAPNGGFIIWVRVRDGFHPDKTLFLSLFITALST